MSSISLNPFFDYLSTIINRGVKPGLERMLAALEILGHPEKKYQVIHIAGTNGKGSVCYMLAQMLGLSGYQVGLAISPHIDDYRERIQLAEKNTGLLSLIPAHDLLQTHQFLVDHLPKDHELTYFEWNILLALQYFADKKCDFAVLETGLGGRLDATNVTDSILSGVVTIGFDHMEYLGDTLEKILGEKLGIVKPKSDFLCGLQDEALRVQAQNHCLRVGAEYHDVLELKAEVENILNKSHQSHSKIHSYLYDNLKFVLGLGLLLCKQGCHVDFNKFLSSENIQLPPARLEIISKSPLILLDGAHNEHALHALKNHLKMHYDDNYDLVFGCLSNRNFIELAEIIKSSHQNKWIRFDGGQQTTPEQTYIEVQKKWGGEIVSLDERLKKSVLQRSASDLPLVICGSLYLCGQFRKFLL